MMFPTTGVEYLITGTIKCNGVRSGIMRVHMDYPYIGASSNSITLDSIAAKHFKKLATISNMPFHYNAEITLQKIA